MLKRSYAQDRGLIKREFMLNRSYAKEKGYYKNKLCYYAKVMLIEFMLRRSYVNRIYV